MKIAQAATFFGNSFSVFKRAQGKKGREREREGEMGRE